MTYAILDFGTNTFNLLIAEKVADSFRVIYTGKQGVKLGKGGINSGFITGEAKERAIQAVAEHMKIIEKYGVNDIRAYATSAMRNAKNGQELADELHERFGFTTHIIEGSEEAELIYEGISTSVDYGKETALILDIGGGSNEFIICTKDQMLWKHSFELGMARIIERFHPSDPIRPGEVQAIENYYMEELELLLENAKVYQPTMLVGASGTFDTLAAMSKHRFGSGNTEGESSFELDPAHFDQLYHLLLPSTSDERLKMPGMEPVRVELIVPAVIFINFVLSACGLKRMIQSAYALKEGVMSRIVKK